MTKDSARALLAHFDTRPAKTARDARRRRQLADEARRTLAKRTPHWKVVAPF